MKAIIELLNKKTETTSSRNTASVIAREAREQVVADSLELRIIKESLVEEVKQAGNMQACLKARKWGTCFIWDVNGNVNEVEKTWFKGSEALQKAIAECIKNKRELLKFYAENPSVKQFINVTVDFSKLERMLQD